MRMIRVSSSSTTRRSAVTSVSSEFRTGVPARVAIAVALGLVVANCSTAPQQRQASRGGIDPKYGVAASPKVVADGEAVPKGGGRDMVGRPYVVGGRLYTPREAPGYSAVGVASWYGPSFHGRMTANGEVFDKMSISAAHPTMPLPSYVRVTNVGNGHSIIARVNDRGPYHGGRLIDVSQRVAEALRFRHLGTARVRVDYVGRASTAGSDDSKLYATLRTDGMPAALDGRPTMVAQAETAPEPRSVVTRRAPEPEESAPVTRASAPVPAVQAALARPAPGTPLPPDRPFDLGTIPNAAQPVPAPLPRSAARQGGTVQTAGLYFAADETLASPLRRADPIAAILTAQRFVPLRKP